ncbi:unnamed protein product [Rhodiola kirilowii]
MPHASSLSKSKSKGKEVAHKPMRNDRIVEQHESDEDDKPLVTRKQKLIRDSLADDSLASDEGLDAPPISPVPPPKKKSQQPRKPAKKKRAHVPSLPRAPSPPVPRVPSPPGEAPTSSAIVPVVPNEGPLEGPLPSPTPYPFSVPLEFRDETHRTHCYDYEEEEDSHSYPLPRHGTPQGH